MNRSVPVHPAVPLVGAGLAVAVAVLETAGLGVRLFDVHGPLGRLFAVDAPVSLVRFVLAGVLAAVALGAVAASRSGGRLWWAAVTVPAALLAVAAAAEPAQVAGPLPGAVRWAVGPAALAVAALVVRWRHRGDHRWRVLALLSAHAVVAGSLPAVAAYARTTGGPVAETFASFIVGSAQALTAVALLVAVLAEALPRLGDRRALVPASA